MCLNGCTHTSHTFNALFSFSLPFHIAHFWLNAFALLRFYVHAERASEQEVERERRALGKLSIRAMYRMNIYFETIPLDVTLR